LALSSLCCRILAACELLDTALTRQKDRIVILHQGPRTELRKYSPDDRSETARRLTNLFIARSPVVINGQFFEEYLIHRTARGEMVRSKSEVIIADHLAKQGRRVRLRTAAHHRWRHEVSRLHG